MRLGFWSGLSLNFCRCDGQAETRRVLPALGPPERLLLSGLSLRQNGSVPATRRSVLLFGAKKKERPRAAQGTTPFTCRSFTGGVGKLDRRASLHPNGRS